MDFGAFVRLRTGVEGLLHVTEMADITPDHPQSLVSPGDLLLLRVLRIEPDRRRIGLSLRQVSETEWAEWAAKYHQRAAEAEVALDEVAEEEVEHIPGEEYEGFVEAEAEEVMEPEAGSRGTGSLRWPRPKRLRQLKRWSRAPRPRPKRPR